jgi:hypothetical protein
MSKARIIISEHNIVSPAPEREYRRWTPKIHMHLSAKGASEWCFMLLSNGFVCELGLLAGIAYEWCAIVDELDTLHCAIAYQRADGVRGYVRESSMQRC